MSSSPLQLKTLSSLWAKGGKALTKVMHYSNPPSNTELMTNWYLPQTSLVKGGSRVN